MKTNIEILEKWDQFNIPGIHKINLHLEKTDPKNVYMEGHYNLDLLCNLLKSEIVTFLEDEIYKKKYYRTPWISTSIRDGQIPTVSQTDIIDITPDVLRIVNQAVAKLKE